MKTAPALAVSSLGVFALMAVLYGPSEAASITLFPVGVLLACAALAAGIRGTVRRGGSARAVSMVVVSVALVILFLAALAVVWMLWALGVIGNAWG